MSRDTLSILKRHLQEKKHSVVLNIIQEHLYFDMYEGVARNKQQIEATAGAVVGEATRQGEWSSGLADGSKHYVVPIKKYFPLYSVLLQCNFQPFVLF